MKQMEAAPSDIFSDLHAKFDVKHKAWYPPRLRSLACESMLFPKI